MLGVFTAEISDLAAAKYYKELALELQEETFQKYDIQDFRLGRCHAEVGTVRLVDEDYPGAEAELRECVDIVRELGLAHSVAEANLGLTYIFQGRYDEANEVLMAGLMERERLFGPMDTESFR